MSGPPFTPNELVPGDTDVVSQYPGVERTFREIMESWMLFEHSSSGHHAFDVASQAALDGDTTWVVGSLRWCSDNNTLQIITGTGPIVSKIVNTPAGARQPWQQTSAPIGWTKEAGAAYNDAAIRSVTGAVTADGLNTAFSARLGPGVALTITQAHLPNVSLTSDSQGAHTHAYNTSTFSLNWPNAAGGVNGGPVTSLSTSSQGAHTHSIPLGGSGTTLPMDIKFIDLIIATKDA